MAKSKQNQVSVSSETQIHILSKNGNFFKAIKDKTKAIAELRTTSAADLKIKTDAMEVKEKANVISLAGLDYWRLKIVDLL